jgi:hypothetical protein
MLTPPRKDQLNEEKKENSRKRMIYVMVGRYDDAIRQIKYLLSIPGFLSTKILELDPRWAPLRNRPEFKKMMESYSGK